MPAECKQSSFDGGIVVDGHKSISTQRPIQQALLPDKLIIPCQQHIGQIAKPVVEVGAHVLKGQLLAQPQGMISAPVHAPTSGTVRAIESQHVPHPSGLLSECIIIEPDGNDTWITRNKTDYTQTSPDELRHLIRDAGIVGLGGAGFPSHVKLSIDEQPHTLILNGAECEPYISCDDMLMRERALEIIQGALIMQRALHAKEIIIGIEDNKPQAIQAMRSATENSPVQICVIPTRYPAGGEKQLIKALTGKEVPSRGIPMNIGIICHNVATAAAVYHAVSLGEPLIQRVVTLTGPAMPEPQNIDVYIGTPIDSLLKMTHNELDTTAKISMGGPLMGFAIPERQVPVIKTSNCLLAEHQQPKPAALPCIRCGQCADACPVNLLPQQLYWYARARDFDKTQDYHLFDCIECACCDFVCPSQIPLVQYFRFAKTEIWQQEQDRNKSDHARERHEFHLERVEREKRERAEKRAQKQAELKKKLNKKDDSDPKKAAIQAALARVKQKKAEASIKPKNTDNLTAAQQCQIAEADKRRKQDDE